MKPEIIGQIEELLGKGIKLHPAPVHPAPFPVGLMAIKKDRPKYALGSNDKLTGLNLAGIKLDDEHWEKIAALLERENVRLQALNVSENELKKFVPPPGVEGLEVIDIAENPLEEPPPDVIKKGNEAILRYFKELKRSGSHTLMETRLLIVGQGGAGKTSLKRKLKDVEEPMPAQGDTTRGIDIEPLKMKTENGEDFTLHVWDFGGQNIQHYAHQFFLTGNSLYVLVHNQREQNTNFQYWLNIIEMLGGSSPVLILQNEVAGHCDPLDNAGSISDRFKNVLKPFYQVDLWNAATDERFSTLKHTIASVASNQELLPHFGTTRPLSFVEVRKKLQAFPKEKQFIPWQTFVDICKSEGVINPSLIGDYIHTFTFLGNCLHFSNDIELRNYVFLRPKWIIDALFTLLYHDKVIRQNGEFTEMDTLEIWWGKDFEGMHGKLIRLMENFELCYPVTDTEDRLFIVPQRLPSAGTSFPWDETETVRTIYRYKFMPKGVITRLTCRLHRLIEDEHVWSDAVIFAKKGTGRIFVRERFAEDEIWIEAFGKKRSDLLNQVVETIDNVHKESKFANLRVEKLVPCDCAVCQNEEEPHLFSFDYLVNLMRDGVTLERCQKSRQEIKIKTFLARIFENGDNPPAYIVIMQKMIEKGFKDTHQKLDDILKKQSTINKMLENLKGGYISDAAQSAAWKSLEPLLQKLLERLPPAEAEEVEQINEQINNAPDLKSKLKLAIPIIPMVLSYETKIEWDWNKVKSSLRGLVI